MKKIWMQVSSDSHIVLVFLKVLVHKVLKILFSKVNVFTILTGTKLYSRVDFDTKHFIFLKNYDKWHANTIMDTQSYFGKLYFWEDINTFKILS